MSLVLCDGLAPHFPLADETVDLVVTSPPYFGLRDYEDDGGGSLEGQIGSEQTPSEFLAHLWQVMDECWRVLKPTGSVFVNLGDRYSGSGGHNNSAISKKSTLQGNGHVGGGPKVRATRRSAPDRYVQASDARRKSLEGLPWRFALGCSIPSGYRPGEDHPAWIMRAEQIWDKRNGLPESVTDRVRRAHEQIFHFTKSETYYAAIDEVREPASTSRLPGGGGTYRALREPGEKDTNLGMAMPNPNGRQPSSVWSMASEPLIIPEGVRERLGLTEHYAAFPTELPRRLILGWSPPAICTRCRTGRFPVEGRWACSCTPRGSRYGQRGDWREGREESPPQRSDDWHSPGAAVPRRPGGFGTKVPAPDEPRWEYYFDGWTPAPTVPAVVLDPFSGTGTTVGVARALGRTGVGFDKSRGYMRLARWRLGESGHFTKVHSRTDADRQGELFLTEATP